MKQYNGIPLDGIASTLMLKVLFVILNTVVLV